MPNFLKQIVLMLVLGASALAQAPGTQNKFASWQANNSFTGTDTFAQGVQVGSKTLAQFPSPPVTGNGTILYCNNCAATNPCSITGTGAVGRYEGGAWNCGGGSGGGGGGFTLVVVGNTLSSANFNNTTPAAAGGFTQVTFQVDGSGNVSAEIPTVTPTTFNGRGPGAISPILTDYQGMQQVGSGTMNILCTVTGTCQIGNTSNFCKFSPTAGVNGFFCQDVNGNGIGSNNGGGSTGKYIEMDINGAATKTIMSQLNGGSWQFFANNNNVEITSDVTGTTFVHQITVPGCIGCGGALPDPFQFNSSLPVSALASVVGKSGLRLDQTDGTLFFVDKAATTTDPWDQVITAHQSGAAGNINSKGLIDQIPVGISTGQFQFFTLPAGALKYTTGAGGFTQASANDLSNTAPGSGPVCLRNGCILVAPALGDFTGSSMTLAGTGPSQIDMSYSGTAPSTPTAGHTYFSVFSDNIGRISINGSNFFQPGPGDFQMVTLCGGSLGASTGTDYIFFPFNQSTTTCTASTAGSATTQEISLGVAVTINQMTCLDAGSGNASDTIKLWKNNAATTMVVAIGAGPGPTTDSAHPQTGIAADTWSVRYHTAQATDLATGMRCTLDITRTP